MTGHLFFDNPNRGGPRYVCLNCGFAAADPMASLLTCERFRNEMGPSGVYLPRKPGSDAVTAVCSGCDATFILPTGHPIPFHPPERLLSREVEV